MDDLDEIWQELLADTAANGAAAGFLADYLSVREANDRIREKAVDQLIAAFEKLADYANGQRASITMEMADQHRFSFENSTARGRSVKFRHGLRCLTIEAGWTRTPRDGIMRGNALAVARISHFGIPKATAELRLIRFEDTVRWFRTADDGVRISVELEDLITHFRTFLG